MFGHVDLGGQQELGVGLRLRIEPQGHRAAAAKTVMKEKIQRQKVGQLVPLDRAFADVDETPFDERLCQMFEHPRVDVGGAADDADVGGVAFVAGSREAEPSQCHAHGLLAV